MNKVNHTNILLIIITYFCPVENSSEGKFTVSEEKEVCHLYNTICNIFSAINNLLWGNFTVFIILAAGIFLTVRCRAVQFLSPAAILSRTIFTLKKNDPDSKKGISNFQALSTALGASMGTGNIIGVAAAISIGGSGAVFWMIMSAFIVMAFAFTENVLGVIYKNRYHDISDGTGPILYIRKGLGSRSLSLVYAAACLAASFGIGSITQSDSAVTSLSQLGISPLFSGALLTLFTLVSVFKGGRFIALLSEKIVPLSALCYIICALIAIIIYGNNISFVLTDIISSAFGFRQAAGGFAGTFINISLTTGLRRGIFSNEAGMGSSVFAHTSTRCDDPCTMGSWAVVEVFIDTVLSCTLTALVILCTGADKTGLEGAAMVCEAFRRCFGNSAVYFVAAANTMFAAASVTGWYYYGEKCADHLVPKPWFRNSYRVLYSAAVMAGALFSSSLLWTISDILNAFVMLPNLAAIIILSKEAVPYAQELRNFH